MADLLKGLVQVKDPLTLFAFVSLVCLAAFRTPRVPQLLTSVIGGLPSDKVYRLVKRCVDYGFVGFVLVCGLAGAGQVLAFTARTHPYSVGDVRRELAENATDAPHKQAAVEAYANGLSLLDKGDFDQAIQSLKGSIDTIPTLAAQYTLALAYQQKHDRVNAAKFATAALATAKVQGDSLAEVRAQRLLEGTDREAATGGKPGLIGQKSALPRGGKSFEDATPASTGRFLWSERLDGKVQRYYKMNLKAGQTLSIDFRTSDAGLNAGASIYDENGDWKTGAAVWNARTTMRSIQWGPPKSEVVYFSVGGDWGGADPDVVYAISVQ